jgi:hypothetical protein
MRGLARPIGWAILVAVAGCGGVSKESIGPGGTDAADACSAYEDVPATSDVVIRIVNRRNVPVYVDDKNGCFSVLSFEASGVTHAGGMSTSQQTCVAARSQPRGFGDCIAPGMAIQTGASWETHWSGLFYDTTEMPDVCYANLPSQPASHPCVQPVRAMPGPMRVRPHVFATSGVNRVWPLVTDPIPVFKDFVFGRDDVVEVIVEGGSTSGSDGGASMLSECVRTCSQDSDCCPGCIATGPYQCNAGRCEMGCVDVADCAAAGFGTAAQCFHFDVPAYTRQGKATGACGVPCATTSDCPRAGDGPPVRCIDVAGQKFCSASIDHDACARDADCAGWGKCDVLSGTCACASDAPCAAGGYMATYLPNACVPR